MTNTKYIKISECRKCNHYRGEVTSNYVRCAFSGEVIGVGLIAPSHNNPGIQNGSIVVRCHNTPQDPEVEKRINEVKKTVRTHEREIIS